MCGINKEFLFTQTLLHFFKLPTPGRADARRQTRHGDARPFLLQHRQQVRAPCPGVNHEDNDGLRAPHRAAAE